MAITKEQWVAIEKELSGYFGSVKLALDGRELTLKKERADENTLCIVVYVDGRWCYAWGNKKSDQFDPFVHRVWWERKIQRYKPRHKKTIIKIWGKREAKKRFPDLDATWSHWSPYFQTFRTLKGKLNKEKDLQLISIGYQSSTTTTTPEGSTIEQDP